MEVGSAGNLDLSREYHKTLFGPTFFFMVALSFKMLVNDILNPFPSNIMVVLFEKWIQFLQSV